MFKPQENNFYTLIYDSIWENPLSTKPNYLAVFLFVVSHAYKKEKSVLMNNQKMMIERGQWLGSILQIAKHFKLSTQTVYRILKYLKTESILEIKSTNKFTLFTVLNYDSYQPCLKAKRKTRQKQIKNKSKATETKDNVYNDNNNNTSIITAKQKPPAKQKQKRFGNEQVNFVLKSFSDLYGFEPTDNKPRFEAFNLVRRFKKFIKEAYPDGKVDGRLEKLIGVYFKWLSKQEWGENIQKLATIRRKTNIFFPFYQNLLERSRNEKTKH